MRFPIPARVERIPKCPLCGSPTEQDGEPYEELQVRSTRPAAPGTRIEALLDNIRSTYNVGSMFRTSDGAGISHIHLCGMTPTPRNPRLAKTALSAQESVPWSYSRNGLATASDLRESGRRLWALEGGSLSRPLGEALADLDGPPIVLVVGNEVSGVDPRILSLCHKVVHIPMQGVKTSLNASVAFGIAAYALCTANGHRRAR
ncbi:MAG TPA: RNA methyltransferase [Deltaproteobacteria bacterium]|nr:RNA methyltransferase [Deltaproteobacteria bacterium]